MEPELIYELMNLGLSLNQARIYLFLGKQGQACAIKDISRNTGLHSQDIYRIVNELEGKGLVTKEMCNPLKARAVELEKALSVLIYLEKKESLKRIQTLKRTAKDLSQTIKSKQREAQTQAETSFNLFSTKKPYMTAAASSLNQARKRYWVAQLVDRFISPETAYKPFVKRLSNRKVDIKFLLLSREERNKKHLEACLREMKAWKSNFEIKCVDSFLYKSGVAIIDDEVWIGIEPAITTSFGSCLRTNDPTFLNAAVSVFMRAWNNPQTELLLSKQLENRTLSTK
jgi:predicted DNA-binding transcriptional regulator